MFDTLRQIERTKDIASVLVKNGFNDIVSAMGVEKYIKFSIPKSSQKELKLSRSERIRKTVEGLGPTFIKMAQILSTRPDLIPLELADEFSKLQDDVEAIPFEQIQSRFVEEFGKDVDEIFDGKLSLIASASLGQVYKGRLKSGEEVAVKVLRPGTQEMIMYLFMNTFVYSYCFFFNLFFHIVKKFCSLFLADITLLHRFINKALHFLFGYQHST